MLTTQSGKRYKHHLTLGHIKHFTIEELKEELENSRFKVIKAYYCGWPFMNFKNVLTNTFYKNIEQSLLKAKKQNLFNRFVFKIFRFLYNISKKTKGPQIFILAKKEID